MRKPSATITLIALASPVVSSCATQNGAAWAPATPVKATPGTLKLQNLPPTGQRIAVAVYNFSDQTGQFKPTDGVQTLSRAVTQGATSILVKALQEAGGHNWFTVIERERLDNILRERAVIREMRSAYLGEKKINPQALPPLLFAGLLLEGGIIGYDSNTKTGGLGARFLGIGGDTKYREDTVTIYLRAVSVKTGEVLTNVSVRKSIASVGLGASAFRYVAFKELLEIEAGVTFNEPDALAMQQAIEEAVYGLILEGTIQGLWCFSTTEDASAGILRRYLAQRDGMKEAEVRMPLDARGTPVNGSCAARQATTALRPAGVPAVKEQGRGAPMPSAPATVKPQAFLRGNTAPAIDRMMAALPLQPANADRRSTAAPRLYARIAETAPGTPQAPAIVERMKFTPAPLRESDRHWTGAGVGRLTVAIPPPAFAERSAGIDWNTPNFCGRTELIATSRQENRRDSRT